ncbi:transmembrane protein 45B-like [Patella vulgata]|uniref:transmembrane protein 45B-like n=1 Tax=Patella vulgata TaxID=6465 RepID=UPI0024A7C5A9|nr:transmembrane protein 45B-like [Patella vulgata]
MGSFGGHALPGSFFFALGLWQTVQSFRRYHRCRNSKGRFKSSTWYPAGSCCKQLKDFPVEPCVKVLMCLVGFIGTIMHAKNFNEILHDPMNEQHMTMYLFFGLNGVLEILTHFNLTFSVYINHISLASAYFVEFILFKFHLHGRTGVDNLLHILLLYVICASI